MTRVLVGPMGPWQALCPADAPKAISILGVTDDGGRPPVYLWLGVKETILVTINKCLLEKHA